MEGFELMSVDADEWMRMKSPRNRTLKINLDTESDQQGRNVIFRTLMPGVFLFLVFYYAFTHSPSVADFYCHAIEDLMSKPFGAAAPPKGFFV